MGIECTRQTFDKQKVVKNGEIRTKLSSNNQTFFQVGAALENRLYNIPSRGSEPISLGFEVTPLEPGLAVVDINPQSGVPPAPIQTSALVNIYEPNTNPLSKQGQATLLTVPDPVIPVPPPIVVVEEVEPDPVSIVNKQLQKLNKICQ